MKHTTSRLIALVLAVLLTLPLALFSGVAAMPDDYTYICQPEEQKQGGVLCRAAPSSACRTPRPTTTRR